MYKIKEAVIVEGVYDKIKLSSIIDGIILTTNGFGVIKDKPLMNTIRELSERTGIVILTDSDAAGFKIRSFIKQSLDPAKVKHAYIPDIKGKEKRKREPGKEGLLGVEGVDKEIILDALKKAGCTIEGSASAPKAERKITKSDFYRLGLSGGGNSAELRRAVCTMLSLPARMSANMLLSVVNRLLTSDELDRLVNEAKNTL